MYYCIVQKITYYLKNFFYVYNEIIVRAIKQE